MLIRRADLDAIVAGDIDLAFRRWRRPTVKAGGTLTTVVGVLAIEAVDRIDDDDVADAITDAEAARAGFASRDELLDRLSRREGDLYRIELRWAGEDPRKRLREQDELTADETTAIAARLERYDRSSGRGPWTARTLALIGARPAALAAKLAAEAGWDTPWLKANVRKLKALGLTESLETGYRLSPRGVAFTNERPEPPGRVPRVDP